MGQEIMGKTEFVKYAEEKLGKHLVEKPSILKKKGKHHITISLKHTVPLSALLEVIKHAHNHAKSLPRPTIIKIAININDKKRSTLRLNIPVSTNGIRNGEPIYPHYELAGGPLHIAPGHPRKNSPNMREIVGQYLSVYLANNPPRDNVTDVHTYSDVGIQLTQNKKTMYSSDVDLVHLVKRDVDNKIVYELTPSEVITNLGKMSYKLQGWDQMITIFKKLAENEGAEIRVKPVVVHVKTDNMRPEWEVDIEEILKKKFPEYKIARITSVTRKNGGGQEQAAGHVEYIGRALLNVAKLPKKYHSPITHIILSHHIDLERLAELSEEVAGLRKLWLNTKIPEHVKHEFLKEYTNIIGSGERCALHHAYHRIKDRAECCAKHIKRIVEKTYGKLKRRGARGV